VDGTNWQDSLQNKPGTWFTLYGQVVLYPPPSLRDTSAGGGYGLTLFAITTQSPRSGEITGFYDFIKSDYYEYNFYFIETSPAFLF